MQKYYIPHKLKIGDIVNLADNDSLFAIKSGVRIEDIINVETNESIFRAVVTNIENKSVEVEILEKIEDRINHEDLHISIVQSIPVNIHKINTIVEKLTEIGVQSIFFIEASQSKMQLKSLKKNFNSVQKVLNDAIEQSRNPQPPVLHTPITFKEVFNHIPKESLKICLTTENVNKNELIELEQIKDFKEKNIVIFIGPESGWSFEEISFLKENGFKFLNLKGNILRTETVSIVISSIIKFMFNKF
ncbi:MAG TPA: RsmE family RNA methyltransferase [Candidatus Dojkabacteria bacterium]|nr:RsmE family RNA methyltransferase [Candidatus Dojkabacteria bacterium]